MGEARRENSRPIVAGQSALGSVLFGDASRIPPSWAVLVKQTYAQASEHTVHRTKQTAESRAKTYTRNHTRAQVRKSHQRARKKARTRLQQGRGGVERDAHPHAHVDTAEHASKTALAPAFLQPPHRRFSAASLPPSLQTLISNLKYIQKI